MEAIREITVIKPTVKNEVKEKLRVAAYCRVSTDSEDQINSFIAQVRYYNDYIRDQADMVLVDVYADEGITGTCMNKRDEFNRMMRDSKAGKVDRIFVKSVSRFARNSLECIESVRELKKYGTTVIFENDGIDTKTMNHELILYIKGAFAQAEAMTASMRVRRSNQMRMENGEYILSNAPFGYKICDGTLEPIWEEVAVVRKMFKYYLSGMGFGKIAQELNNQDVPGKPWGREGVRYILSNEKYIGDTMCQKTFTPYELPFKNRKNRGETDRYYISNSHEAVLDKDTFYAVQEMIEENHKKDAEKSATRKYKFTGKLFCCDCGWRFKKRVQNGISYWTCSKNGTVGQRCITHHLSEEVIERTFCNLYNKLRQYENELMKSTLNRLIELKAVITKSKSEIIKIDEEILKESDTVKFFSNLLNDQSIDQEIYNNSVAPSKRRIAELRDRRKRLIADDDDEKCIDELRKVIAFLEQSPKAIIEYDHTLFEGITDRVIVEENMLAFELKGGIVLREAIAWN